jgi:hypothetical protein
MKNTIIKFSVTVFIFCTLFSGSLLFAEEAATPITVTTHISPNTFTLGDNAIYTIAIQHDPDIRPSAPDIAPPQGLDLIDKGENPPQILNKQIVHEYWYKLQVDAIGKLTLPSIAIAFEAPNPKETGKTIQGTIQAPEVSLQVESLLSIPGNPEGLHDIKPLEDISPPWSQYLLQVLAALALLVGLYFIWRQWKNRQLSGTRSNQTPLLTAEQLAFKELKILKGKNWLEIGRVQDHFFELSEIFRQYLENRYQFPAREWTTEEITHHFKNFSVLSENLKHKARSILTQADRIKFAKAERVEGYDEMQSVINFIEEAQAPVADLQTSIAS